MVLPGSEPTEMAESAQVTVPANADTQEVQTSESPVAPEDPNSWRVKFADKFTDGTVEKNENSYKSANVSVTIETVAKDGVTYFVADIYLADIKYFKTAFAKDTFASGISEPTTDIASNNNAVLAVNGDYCSTNAGPVVRNGVLYRDEEYKSDVLVMNNEWRLSGLDVWPHVADRWASNGGI
jgi:hypothetical protein